MLEGRLLRQEEFALIRFLVSACSVSKQYSDDELRQSLVQDMQDGGMGSIRFVRPDTRVFGKELIQATYTDADGVPVSIALNADNKGDLFELDSWKVDFSRLRRYPKPSEVKINPQGPESRS